MALFYWIFFKKMSAPVKETLVSDYDRSIRKSYKKSKAKSKDVPQLGMQPNQSVEPLLPTQELEKRQFMAAIKLMRVQVLGTAPIKKPIEADAKYKFTLGEPLVKPDQVNNLPTQMYRFHQWYMEKSAKGREMFAVRVQNTDYFQGEDSMWIRFEDVFDVCETPSTSLFSVARFCKYRLINLFCSLAPCM